MTDASTAVGPTAAAGSGVTEPPVGVLIMAHGTPSTPAGIEPFYTTIRRGRPPTPELLDELVGRYAAIGGTSPLTERTRTQVDGIAAALGEVAPGRFTVRYGAKYVTPTIEEAMAELAASSVRRVIGIVLTPHQSSLGSGEYVERAQKAAAAGEEGSGAAGSGSGIEFLPIPSWHRAPGFAQLLADRTGAVLDSLSDADRRQVAVFFTAHSLPLRVVAEGDPYPDQVAESASDVATLLGLDDVPDLTWGVAWQSAGRTADPWIGPDLLVEMRRVAAEGATAVVVCPVGFVSDHLEVLYDLDIEALQVAESVGVAFARTPSLNDDPRFCRLLAEVIVGAADGMVDGGAGDDDGGEDGSAVGGGPADAVAGATATA
jgi:ferrochelatase